jgi:integrase
VDNVAPDEPLIDRPTRWVQRAVERARNELRAETGDEGWQYVTPHDLRRTWGHLLIEDDVEPGIVMEWGGWENWETFREHYLGVYSMQKQREERDKVDWMA